MSIRILLVDDHKLFRRGLAALLRAEADFEIIGEAADGVEGTPTIFINGVKYANMAYPELKAIIETELAK